MKMAGLLRYPLPLLLLLSVLLSPVHSQSSEEGKSNEDEDVETVAGFLIYRFTNENSNSSAAQYLLLKAAGSEVWSPPMVKWGGRGTGTQVEAAIRATREETGLAVNTDYIAFTGSQDQVFFQYEKKEILNRVYLWPARLLTFEKPIQLSAKHSEYAWVEYEEAQERINQNYRTGLTLGNGIISSYVSKFVPYSYYSLVEEFNSRHGQNSNFKVEQ